MDAFKKIRRSAKLSRMLIKRNERNNTQKELSDIGKKAIETKKKRNSVQRELSVIPEYSNHINLKDYTKKVKDLRNNAQGSLSLLGKKAVDTQKKRNNSHKQLGELSDELGQLSKYHKFIRETKNPRSEEYARAINTQIAQNALKNIAGKGKSLLQKRDNVQKDLSETGTIMKMIDADARANIAHNALKNIAGKSKDLLKKRNNAQKQLGYIADRARSPPLTEDNVERYINKGLQKKASSQKFLNLIGKSAKLIKENRNHAHRSLKNIGRKAIRTQINRNNAQNQLKHKVFMNDFLKKINGEITDLKKGNGHMLPMYQVDEIIKKYEEMIKIIKAKQEESDERMEESYQDLLNDFLQTQKKYNDLDENCSTLQERYNKLFESYNELVDLMEEPQNSEMDNKDMVLNRKKETLLNRKLNSKIKNMTKTIENMRYKNNKEDEELKVKNYANAVSKMASLIKFGKPNV
jgi:hypothetical protein